MSDGSEREACDGEDNVARDCEEDRPSQRQITVVVASHDDSYTGSKISAQHDAPTDVTCCSQCMVSCTLNIRAARYSVLIDSFLLVRSRFTDAENYFIWWCWVNKSVTHKRGMWLHLSFSYVDYSMIFVHFTYVHSMHIGTKFALHRHAFHVYRTTSCSEKKHPTFVFFHNS